MVVSASSLAGRAGTPAGGFKYLRRCCDDVSGQVAHYYRPSADYGIFVDRHPWADDDAAPEPHVIPKPNGFSGFELISS